MDQTDALREDVLSVALFVVLSVALFLALFVALFLALFDTLLVVPPDTLLDTPLDTPFDTQLDVLLVFHRSVELFVAVHRTYLIVDIVVQT
ncbi:hypothetical protein [Bacillus sp. EB600]|uniref:hypothetical protein n=1 Tax=Bacillus sp. EB600 TaxID=2806345 RepID=UPI00210B5305|nr:hypothetical protein [Bacillus sp. EB600]MCQ6282798.1 hypothetical protein [Bacillus sp. EB600]